MSQRYIGAIESNSITGINWPVTQVEYLVVAGGGGGGSAVANTNNGGGGGGGGLLTATGYAVTIGSSITVTVGATSGNITVTPSNVCGNGTARTLAVTTNSIPASLASIIALFNASGKAKLFF